MKKSFISVAVIAVAGFGTLVTVCLNAHAEQNASSLSATKEAIHRIYRAPFEIDHAVTPRCLPCEEAKRKKALKTDLDSIDSLNKELANQLNLQMNEALKIINGKKHSVHLSDSDVLVFDAKITEFTKMGAEWNKSSDPKKMTEQLQEMNSCNEWLKAWIKTATSKSQTLMMEDSESPIVGPDQATIDRANQNAKKFQKILGKSTDCEDSNC